MNKQTNGAIMNQDILAMYSWSKFINIIQWTGFTSYEPKIAEENALNGNY